ncbi:MAG: sugar kinase [bacterium]|nr:sugar kinase [bacterium]
MTDSNLLIVGSIGLDTIETQSDKVERVLGGAAVYSSCAAANLTHSAIVGVVGDDFPAEHETMLKNKNIDLTCMQKKPGKTFFWHGRYRDDMNERDTLDTQLGVFGEFKPEIPASHANIPYLFLANIHPQLQLDVLDAMQGKPFVAADSMNLWIDTTPDLLKQVIRRVDVLFVNDEEAKMITGQSSVLRAADAIIAMGPSVAVIKKGDAGAMLISRDDVFATPAIPLREVKDPTGAGDTFAGGMMGYIARQNDRSFETMKQAAVLGSVMASFTVEDFSLNRLANVSPDDVRERIERLRCLTVFKDIEI